MFTGLIETTGTVLSVEQRAGSRLITIAAPGLKLRTGDSIAVSGVCLTAIGVETRSAATPELESEPESNLFRAELAAETVARTSLSTLLPRSTVNLELPTPAGAPLGGHIVQGHVDDTGKLLSLTPLDSEADRALTDWRLRVAVPRHLGPYMVEKGSIAIEGISLTIARWAPDTPEGDVVEAAIIPYTYAHTNLSTLSPGQLLNIEADVLLKFQERRGSQPKFDLTVEYLIANGY